MIRRPSSSGFEEKLLVELKRVIVERQSLDDPETIERHRSPWRRRVAMVTALAAAFAVAIVAVLPIIPGRDSGPASTAYAVTEGADGVVTVEIRSIEDAAGPEAAIEATGVPASVHYLPAGKVCTVPRDRLTDLVPVGSGSDRPHVTIGQGEDGVFTFSFDTTTFSPGDSIVVDAQYAPPEHGQPFDQVASIGTAVLHGDFDSCELRDGTISGWTFQEGAVPRGREALSP
jgi:hypothetical protein